MYKNIQFHIMNFCNGLVFFAPVAILLRTTKGVTLSQFFLLQALLSVMIFLFEIPTGMLADRLGYKKAILFSQIILFFARAIFLVADCLVYFVVEAMLEAFSCCFMSGTGEAYLYERCKIDGDEELFMVESAKAKAWGTAGFIVSTLGYAVLYYFKGLNGLVIATEIATLFALIAVVFMPEVDKQYLDKKIVADKPMLPKLPATLWKFMAMDAVIGMTGLIINFLYAEKLEWSGIAVEWMAPIILGYSVLELFVPRVIALLHKKNDVNVYKGFSLVSAVLLIGIFLFHNYLSVFLMMLVPFLLNIVEMIQYKYENKYIDELGQEKSRATLLSMINMGNNLLEILFLLLSAVISSRQGNAMFLFAGILLAILAVLGSGLIRKTFPLQNG